MTELKQGTAAVEHRDCTDGPETCRKIHPDRCVTPTGKPTTPHAGRWKAGGHYADGYNSRQAELDAQTNLVTSLRATNDQLAATLKASDDKLEIAMQRITNLAADLKDAQDERDALQKRLDEPKPTETVLYANPAVQRIRLPAGKRGGGAGANGAFRLVRG